MKNSILIICLFLISGFAACTKKQELPENPQTAPSHQYPLKSGEDDDLPIVNEQVRKKNGAAVSNVKVLFIDSTNDTTSQFTNATGFAQLALPHFGTYNLYLESPLLFSPFHDVVTIMDSVTYRTDTLDIE